MSDYRGCGCFRKQYVIVSVNGRENEKESRHNRDGRDYHFVLLGDGLGLLVTLEPHHELGVETPRLLLERFGGQVLRLGALQVVKDEEQRLRRQPVEEVERVRRHRHRLRVVHLRHVRRPGRRGKQRKPSVSHVSESFSSFFKDCRFDGTYVYTQVGYRKIHEISLISSDRRTSIDMFRMLPLLVPFKWTINSFKKLFEPISLTIDLRELTLVSQGPDIIQRWINW